MLGFIEKSLATCYWSSPAIVGADGKDGYAAASLTAFGDSVPGGSQLVATDALFTGKPHVDGLGYAFLFRNYRPTLGKWQTADPLGYPDGWNQLAYCGNSVSDTFDWLGGRKITLYLETDWVYTSIAGSYFPLTNVFKYMQDSWELGTAVMGALKIKTISDFIKKMSEALSDSVRDEVSKLVKNDSWLHVLLLAVNGLGYAEIPPKEDEIYAEFHRHTGRTRTSWISCSTPVLYKVDVGMDSNVSGLFMIEGATQYWRVVVTYE